MAYMHLIYVFYISLISSSYLIKAQQPYIGLATTRCSSTNNSTSVLGYTCNGISPRCQAYLAFRSRPPFSSVSSISGLLGADQSQLSQLNSVPEDATFEPNKMVLVPVNCSCSGQYYQVNTSYVVQSHDTFLIIANNTFQGLSTCQALIAQNSNLTTRNIYRGMRLTVPLRCACPTKNQSSIGVKYLLSYLVTSGQYVSLISNIFQADTGRTLEANGLSEENSVIYPFTTLLIPLENRLSSSQIIQPPTSPPPPPPLSPVHSLNKSSNKTWVYVVAGVLGGLAILSIIGAIIFCMFFRISTKKSDAIISSESFEAVEKPSGKSSEEESEILDGIASIALSLKLYTFEELKSATENFSPSSCIKGSVYRGKINGDLAAIKKINGDVSEEINLLNKISHFNLIRLCGVCYSDGTWYLVYEYAVNGSLSNWIYDMPSNRKSLTWSQRIQIAFDVATGLNYLHSYASPPYVHKDIRSGSVLLDGDYRAKISNFSSARSADGDGGQFVFTRHVVGTKGYMAPEYLENGMISPKLDVYSFGTLFLEMVTGKQISLLYEGVNSDLSLLLRPILHEEDGEANLRDFMDPSLQGNYPAELAIVVVRLIDSCISKIPSARPDMDEIVQNLSRTMNASLSREIST